MRAISKLSIMAVVLLMFSGCVEKPMMSIIDTTDPTVVLNEANRLINICDNEVNVTNDMLKKMLEDLNMTGDRGMVWYKKTISDEINQLQKRDRKCDETTKYIEDHRLILVNMKSERAVTSILAEYKEKKQNYKELEQNLSAITFTQTPIPQVITGSYENPASVGTMITDDVAEFTVLEVNRVSHQSILTANQYRDDAPAGYKFDLIKIQIKNIGDKELQVYQYQSIRIFKDGVEIQQAMMMNLPTQFPELKGGAMMPGATMTGWLVAIVPEDTGYLIQYKSNMFNSRGGWVQVT